MNKDNVILSICIVTYNHEKYIKECIDSVFKQKINYTTEIIVGNDCSTDRTAEILEREYGSRIQLINRENNVGLCENMYNLFMKARGKYIFLLSGDDYLYLEDALFKQVKFLEENPEYFSVSAKNYNYMQAEKRYVSSKIQSGEYTICDFLNDGKIPCILGTMRNIFSRDKMHNDFLRRGARNNEELKMWIYTLDKGKKYILDDYMTVYRFVSTPGQYNYCSTKTTIDLFNDYYQDIKIVENIYGGKYNLKPLKMLFINKYCILQSDSIYSLFQFIRCLSIKDLISLFVFKIYLKMSGYKTPKYWKEERYLLKEK